jgi:hypothetical protein
MAVDPHETRLKEYPIFTLVCFFYFFYAFASYVVAKLKIVITE